MPRRSLFGYGVIVLVAAVAGTSIHAHVLFSDNAMFEYAGRAMVRGLQLYRNVWDKPPGIYLANALWQRLFGSAYLLHVAAEIAVGVVSAILTGAIAAEFGVRRWPLVAAAAAIVLCDLTLAINAVEYDALPFILAAVLLARNGRAAAAGVAVALACAFWIPAILMVIPLAILVRPLERIRLAAAAALALAAGAAIFGATAGLGTLRLLAQSWVAYVPSAIAPAHRRFALLGPFLDFVDGLQAAGAGMLVVLLLGNLRRPRTEAERFVLAWVVTLFAATCVGLRFYPHYDIPAVAATIVAIGVFGVSLRGARAAFVAVAFVAAIGTVLNVASYVTFASARTALADRIGQGIVAAIGPAATLDVPDDYAPELYLFADASLRNPYEIVAGPNAAFLARLHVAGRPAAVTILTAPTTAAPRAQVRVCRTTAAPWRVFTIPSLAARFDRCS